MWSTRRWSTNARSADTPISAFCAPRRTRASPVARSRVFDARVERLRERAWSGAVACGPGTSCASARACRVRAARPFHRLARKNHRDEKDRANYFDTRFARHDARRFEPRAAPPGDFKLARRTSVMRAPSSPRVPRGRPAARRIPALLLLRSLWAAEAARRLPAHDARRGDDALAPSQRMAFADVPPRPPRPPRRRPRPARVPPAEDPSAAPRFSAPCSWRTAVSR